MHWLFTYGKCHRWSKAVAVVLASAMMTHAQDARAPVVVLAFGDSLIHGYGLPPEQGFVPQMQAWLDKRGHSARLINGGVSGDTTAGGLARLEWSLTSEVDAMILALGGNDVLRGLAPDKAYQNIDGILRIADRKGIDVLLVPVKAPGNYGAAYETAFDGIFPALAVKHDIYLSPGFFSVLLDDGETLTDIAHLLQSDGIHPNAEGVARIVKNIGPHVENLVERKIAD